ncbi:MAG: hypothetical protein ACI4I6_07700 [Hominimerdicola sp.]
MYKCDTCGKVVDELPVITEKYPCGDGFVNRKVTDDDCECGGILEEAFTCKTCDEVKICSENADNYNEVCDECLKDLSRNMDVVRKAFTNKDGGSDELIEYLIGIEHKTVSEVLWEYIERQMSAAFFIKRQIIERASAYVEYDLSDFAERLKSRGIIK